MQEIDDYIDQAKSLPPAPRVVPQLLTLLSRADVDCDEVVKLIAYDPSLTASVIRLCNSAYFAGSMPASDLREAATRLGFRQVYQMVVAILGSQAMSPSQPGYGIDEGELWRHAVVSAIAAELIAKDKGEDTSVVFTAALLHDIGKIVLSQALEHTYAKLIEDVEINQHSLLEAEKRLLGVHHAEVGGRLLTRWKFPDHLVAAVQHHHEPSAAGPHERLAAYVYLGNMIAYFTGSGYGGQAFALRGRADALEILGCAADDLPLYMIQAVEEKEAVETLLTVHT